MRKGFAYLLAVSVCLALAFTPLMADRVDRTADRTKGADRTAAGPVDWQSTVGDQLYRPNNGLREGGNVGTQGRAAELVSQAAQAEGSAAISLLLQAVSIDLEQNVENEKLLSEAYARLGELYQGSAAKQVHWYSLAMQYTPDPNTRAQLERQISTLGGDAFAFAVTPRPTTAGTRDCGVQDTCGTALAVTLDYSAVLTIDNYSCIDHEWFSFDVPGPDGYIVEIETMSTDIYGDDTDLELWDGCPGNLIADDDDGGPGFLSLITTPCLAPGTYYVAVGGWLDWASPDNFDFNMTLLATCVLPEPDGYEPDSIRIEANPIGHPTAIPLHANGWGRAKKEIQDHNIFPAADPDFVSFVTRKNMWVTMETRGVFPTFFNDFTGTVGYDNPDTYIELLYGNEPNYGGLCNDPDIGFGPWCFTDADCTDLPNPLPSFPDCIPMQYFTVGGAPYWFWENPLAYNDMSGEGFSSKLQICLPRGDHQTTSGTASGDWLLRVWPYSASDMFDYQVMVRNEADCAFEVEPNNDFPYATPLTLGVPMSGITDQSNYDPNSADIDLYSFDVGPDGAEVLLETTGYDIYECDNAFELYVGPDDYGYYYFTGFSVDDCYGWLPCADLLLPQADDLLGNMYADANYLLNVTTWWLNKNFPYTLLSAELALPTLETEPNDTCATANDVETGANVAAYLDDYYITGYCDYDSFHLAVAADTLVTFETDGAIDTTMALYDGDGNYLGCDDDSGYSLGSLISGCLPAGDYCVQVRGYGYWTYSNYSLTITDGGTCSPTVPVYLGEYGLRCDGGQAEFETCPN